MSLYRLVAHQAARTPFLAATLVLLLDLQIEPVATAINRYWVWLDGGGYYGVPAANFAAWWVVGLVMAAVVGRILGKVGVSEFPEQTDQIMLYNEQSRWRFTFYVLRFTFYAIPAGLYLLNTLMFAAINLAWGYTLAGVVGLAVLVVSALRRASEREQPPVQAIDEPR